MLFSKSGIRCQCGTLALLQERFDYLARYRRVVPEEDFEVAMKAYEWPKKFVSIMKEAATKATSGTRLHTHCMHHLPSCCSKTGCCVLLTAAALDLSQP